jgi:hypothetical protein
LAAALNTRSDGAEVAGIDKMRCASNQIFGYFVFDDVDWMSYHTSLHKIPRAHRVSITKLSQRLWNTNMQTTNTIHSAMCPACQRNNETIGHVYSCKEPTVLKVRETALALFTDRQPVQSGTTTTPGGDVNRYQTLCVSSPNY